jgi:riboflavin kinase/FMN adenylyltransferase
MILKGLVEAGAGRGKTQFVPTINVLLQEVPIDLLYGVYPCRVLVDGVGEFKAVAHYGPRASLDGLITFEVHLLEFNQDIYGVEVEINLFQNAKIRDIVKFENLDELKIQIQKDIESANSFLDIG